MSEISNRRRWWTQEEDRILQEGVKDQELGGQQGARNWSAIAEKLPGRSNKDCRKRWTKISLSSRKGTWSGAEDHLLRKAVAKFGFQWTKVAEMVGSRHPDQCAKRWHHSLDPNVKRGPWSAEEDEALIDAVQRIGRDWKEIGRGLFPSRSTTDIKNRYVILNRRRGLTTSSQDNCLGGDDSLGNNTPQPTGTNSLIEMNILTPNVDLPLATTPCDSDIFNLTADDLSMPGLPPYIFDDAQCFLPLPNIADSDIPFIDNTAPTVEAPDWATFDKQQQNDAVNVLSPGASTTSEIESCDPSLLPNTSYPETPNVSDCSSSSETSGPSTLVLEDLRPETVNLVINTLLRTNSKFGMRLYNTGS